MQEIKSQIEISLILNRIKKAYKLDTDGQLANHIGIKQNTLSSWRGRNTIDFKLIFSKCDKLNLNWLIYGKGEPLEIEIEDIKQKSHKEKICDFLTSKKISKNQFYEKTGFSNGFLDSGKSINSEKIPKIKESFPDLNIDWLLFDKGTMTNYDNYSILNDPKETYNKKETDSDILLGYIKEKDKTIQKITEENGKLKEQIRVLKKEGYHTLHGDSCKSL